MFGVLPNTIKILVSCYVFKKGVDMKRRILFIVMVFCFCIAGVPETQAGPFKPNRESLRKYKCPEWFRDAKLGFWAHWNAAAVPAVDGHYARNMYIEGHKAYKYHLKHYGHPSKFGYKDIIPLWKAEKFDADHIVKLFKQAGAKYIASVAVHHDNFDLWNSKYHKWNSLNMGPKKDIVDLWRKATLKQGLRFGVTTHLARSYTWFQTSHLADKEGPYKGVPYDGKDPNFEDFYFETHDNWHWRTHPNPPKSWRDNWSARLKDLIDSYHPDIFYFDGAVPFEGGKARAGMEVIAHFYNQNSKWHNGRQEGVMFIKKPSEGDGIYMDDIATKDFEVRRSEDAMARPWQTDTTISSTWFWIRDMKYRTVTDIVHELVDVVSKNGNILLNVPIQADGTLDSHATQILVDMGKWIDINGQAIYGTRPWKQFSECSVRFTTKAGVLYAITLEWPESGVLTIPALATGKTGKVLNIFLLGSEDTLKWSQDNNGLKITLPKTCPCEHAWSFGVIFK